MPVLLINFNNCLSSTRKYCHSLVWPFGFLLSLVFYLPFFFFCLVSYSQHSLLYPIDLLFMCRFTYSRHFIQVDKYMWSFVMASFIQNIIWGLFMFQCISIHSFFIWLNKIPLYGYNTLSLSTYQWMNMWMFPHFDYYE